MKTRRRIKRKVLYILIGVVLIACGILIYKVLDQKEPIKEDKSVNNNDNVKPVIKEEVKKVSLFMVGDALIHDPIYKGAYDSATKTYDFRPMLEFVKPISSTYDLAFYNQETILGGAELGLSGWPSFNSPYEVGDAFIDAGFNMVSTATNHTYDKKEKGVINSCNYWAKKDNVYMSGTKLNSEESDVKIFEKNGIKFAYVAYTKGLNGNVLPKGEEYLVNVFSYDKAKTDIESVRDKVDFVIVSMHWGKDVTSYTNPSPEPWTKYAKGLNPKEQAEYLANLGVDLIIGTHPHIINPIEWIDNTLVYYSLGNFISSQSNDSNYNKRIGLMGSVEFTKTIKGEEVLSKDLKSTNNELVYTYIKGNTYKAIPFSKMDNTYNKNYKSLYETYTKVIKMYDGTLPVASIE